MYTDNTTAPTGAEQQNAAMQQATLMAEFWKHAAPAGRCSCTEIKKVLSAVSMDVSTEKEVDRDEFLAALFQKRPGTPSLLSCALKSRATLLLAAAAKEPAPSPMHIWPDGEMPTISAEGAIDEQTWQDVLVKFGAGRVSSARAAQHFLDTIQAGMDPNCVAFPRMQLRGRALPRPASGRKVGIKSQDEVAFPLFVEPSEALAFKTEAEHEAYKVMIAGRAKTPENLREPIYSEAPLDFELSSWPLKPDGVIAADECTDAQISTWEHRAKRGPLYAKALQKRRGTVLNAHFFDEIRPELDEEAALSEMRARWARDKAVEVREHDELAEQGAALVAWPVAGERRWPAPDAAWKRHAEWFKKWRAQPRIASSFHPRERSNSEASIKSWLSVSDISWVEIESIASDLGWQHVVDKEASPSELRAATRASLDCFSKADVQELKAYGKPPRGVETICACVMHLLAGLAPDIELTKKGAAKDASWKGLKKLVCSPGQLLKTCADFPDAIDEGRVPRKNIERTRRIMNSMGPDFYEVMKQKSLAVSGLVMWVSRSIAYYDVAAPSEVTAPEAERPTCVGIGQLAHHEASSLSCLSKADIVELKALARPPVEVYEVMAAVVCLLGSEEKPSWEHCKQVFGDACLLRNLLLFDAQKASPVALAQAKAIAEQPFFCDAIMRKKSAAAAGLVAWTLQVLDMTTVAPRAFENA